MLRRQMYETNKHFNALAIANSMFENDLLLLQYTHIGANCRVFCLHFISFHSYGILNILEKVTVAHFIKSQTHFSRTVSYDNELNEVTSQTAIDEYFCVDSELLSLLMNEFNSPIQNNRK